MLAPARSSVPDDDPAAVLAAAYGALSDLVAAVDDERSWLPTRCLGWSVRDVVFHCVADAQRGLVAMHTPTGGAADRTAVTYWAGTAAGASGSSGAANGRRFTRVVASLFLDFTQLRDLSLETAAAVVRCASSADATSVVETQGCRLTTGDLLVTLAVEATIHHLDLQLAVPDGAQPSVEGLAAVRASLDGLLGHPLPDHWDDVRCALVATGRAVPTRDELSDLGAGAARLPLLA